MAGYNDTKQLIIDALTGRPVGTEIQPENQQAYELNMLDYIRSIELIGTSTLQGIAESTTTPVQPDTSKSCYIAGVNQNETVVFNNFFDNSGNPISITTGEMEGLFVILMWNTSYWTAYTFTTNILSSSETATFYYNYNIKKTYDSFAALDADKTNPIGDDGKPIQLGNLVSVVNTVTPAENAFYSRIEGDWQFQGTYNFNVVQVTGTSTTDVMSQDAVTDQLALKIDKTAVKQTTGTSTTDLMSQKAVTDELGDLELEQIQGGIYDVSSHNDSAVFESLSTLLGSANLSTLIPTSVRRGGMSIRFIQGSAPNPDNKYMQYFCNSKTFSTIITDWEKANLENENYIKGFFSKELIEHPSYSNQKRIYCYGNFKNGDKIVVWMSGTGVASVISVRYDDGTTIISSILCGGIKEEITLTQNTSCIIFIVFDSLVTQDGTFIANAVFDYALRIIEVTGIATKQDTQKDLKALNINNNVYNIKDDDIVKTILSDNLIDPLELIYGKYISDNKGILSNHDNWVTTGYIDVSQLSEHTVYTSRLYNGFFTCPFNYALAYDIDKNPISASYTGNTDIYSLLIQSEYKYLRVCFRYFEGAKWQVTDGQATEYSEYVGYNRLKNSDYVLPSQIPSPGTIESIEEAVSYINDTLDEHLMKDAVGENISFEIIANKVINTSGQIIDTTTGTGYSVSEPISVIPGNIYYITAAAHYHKGVFAWYNNETFIDGIFSPSDDSELDLNDYKWICPTGVNYIRVANMNSNIPLVKGNIKYSSPDKFLKWAELKWAAIGDSLTEVNRRTTLHYFDYISQETGISVINLGKSGTGYKKAYNTYLPFYQRLDTITSDSDVITIFGSFNDLSAGELGEITDTTTDTVCGCINITLDGIYNLYPTKPLGIITPTPWGGYLTGSYLNYVNALIAICEKRGIPYLDLFHCSNFHGDENFKVLIYSKDGTYSNSQQSVTNAIQVTEDNINTINSFLVEGSTTVSIGDWVLPNLSAVHPNELGHRLIAPRFKAFLETLLM